MEAGTITRQGRLAPHIVLEPPGLRTQRKPAPEPEPKVLTEDVQRILRRVVKPDDPDEGDSVSLIAEKANTSTRTVYRCLARTSYSISLDLADRLCLAADAHVSACRLVLPSGEVVAY